MELAWKLPPSTWRYLVLTVCDLSRLKSAILDPDSMHTANIKKKCHAKIRHMKNIYLKMSTTQQQIITNASFAHDGTCC